MSEKRLIVGVTGASGSVYARKFLDAISDRFDKVYLIVSENAESVIRLELGDSSDESLDAVTLLQANRSNIQVCRPGDLFAPPSSGSVHTEGMVIIPCSMGTVGRIAAGISNDLITRAADVCLKERRPLILVPREAPLSLIHLRNLTSLAEAGATILPASPAFYHQPQSIDDLVSFVIARVMQQLGLEQDLAPEWKGIEE